MRNTFEKFSSAEFEREMNTHRKKLIEVALPLDAINAASAREKSIRHGHPSTLHLWWARRPLAAARAVIFAQMVDDPSACPEEFPTEADQEKEQKCLFRLIEELVKWRTRPTRPFWNGRDPRSANPGVGPAPTMRTILVRANCSTLTSCRLFTTPSRVAAHCRWKPSALVSKPTPATSTRWLFSSTRR